MSEPAVDVFFATLPLFGEEPKPVDWALLSNSERSFARGLPVFEGRDFVRVRSFIRNTLGRHLSVDPAAVTWMPDDLGKPELEGGHALHFSYAYHDTSLAVLIACREFPIGVDAADLLGEEADELLLEHFPQLASKCSDSANVFARAWTQWEALLKASGTGFTDVNPDPSICRIDAEPVAAKLALNGGELTPRALRFEEQNYALLELAFTRPVACALALKLGAEATVPRVRVRAFQERPVA